MVTHTFPPSIFTIYEDPSSELVRARVEFELIAKHVNPLVWYPWPGKQSLAGGYQNHKEKQKKNLHWKEK